MKNIFTFGSCLSIGIANSLSTLGGWSRASSTQHNRVDQFVNTYILNNKPRLSFCDKYLEIKKEFSYTNVLQNQVDDWGLGRALPGRKDILSHPIDALNKGIDLAVIDNFPEIYFKTYHNQISGLQLFLNSNYFTNIPKEMKIEAELPKEEHLTFFHEKLIELITSKNKNTFIVFVNFPVNLNPKKPIRDRAKRIEKIIENKLSETKNLYIIPSQGLYRSDLNKASDIHHFTKRRYMDYALIVDGAYRNFREKM